MKKVEISCNIKVKNYTTCQIKSLTGLSVEKACEYLIKEGCLPMAESAGLLRHGRQLIKRIESFKFPTSVPVSPVDERHIWQFGERWKKHLREMLKKMVSSCKPIYLADEVNKHLRRRKSSIKCSRLHLMWYLDLYSQENMTPEAIAKALIKFGVTNWSQVQPLKNNAKYILHLKDDNIEIDQEEFERLVEFIYGIPKPKAQTNLIDMIQNDIKVLEEFRKMWNSAPPTYDYTKVFDEYASRLQTLSPSKKRVSLAKENKKLSPKAQLALVRKHECPLCGHPLIQKISHSTGRQYIAHESGSGCRYIAWGTFDDPSIHDDYNKTIILNKDHTQKVHGSPTP